MQLHKTTFLGCIHAFLGLALIVILIPAYWIGYFYTSHVAFSQEDFYKIFELCFFLVDFWLVFAAIIGIIGIFKRKHWGILFAVMTGSGLIVIALMDTMYHVIINRNSMYLLISSQSILIEMAINCFVIIWGIYIIRSSWTFLFNFDRL